MTTKKQTLSVGRDIPATPAAVYAAFTERDWLQRWLCDKALVAAKVGGYFLLTEEQPGKQAIGAYTVLEPGAKIAFTWRETGEKADSQIEIALTERGKITHVQLTHGGLTAKGYAAYKLAWENHLRNLQSVLETGVDLRIAGQSDFQFNPVYTNDPLEPKLKLIGVPVTEGAIIGSVAAGTDTATKLQADDVIVAMDDKPVRSFADVYAILDEHKIGDMVKTVFYRRDQKQTVDLPVAALSIPALPATFAALGDLYEKHYAQLNAEFTTIFEGLTEAEASQAPAPGEWNVKEVLAHLILSERPVQYWIGTFLQEPRPHSIVGWVPACIAGMVKTNPSAGDMLAEMRRCWTEMVNLLRSLPPELSKDKNRLWRANLYLDRFLAHEYEHLGQAKKTAAAVRS